MSGFSERDAGLGCRGAEDARGLRQGQLGPHGQSSLAQYAKWCMLITRTDPGAPKHKGLSYFLMCMEQEAVQVRSLPQMTGESEFNELLLDQARAPAEDVLGGGGRVEGRADDADERPQGVGFFLGVRLRQLLDRLIDEAVPTSRALKSASPICESAQKCCG